jgi:DNA-binding NarL/FixJ family response regulator
MLEVNTCTSEPRRSPLPTRVVLADDHQLVRSAIRALLEMNRQYEVAGEAANAGDLLKLLHVAKADVAICDLRMPGMEDLEFIPLIRGLFPQVRLLVLTMDDAPASALQVMRRGAHGYLLKHSAATDLDAAIASVLAGGTYLSSPLALALCSGNLETPDSVLTERQIQILRLIACGATSREVAARLGISAKTVDVHRSRIQERLGVHDIAGLTRYAMKHHLVS